MVNYEQNKSIRRLLLVANSIIFVYLLMQNREEMNNTAVFFSFLTIVMLVAVYCILNKYTVIKKSTIVISFLLSILFILQMSLSDLFEAPFTRDNGRFFSIISVVIILLDLTIAISFLINFLLSGNCDDGTLSERKMMVCKLWIILETVLFATSTYPAIWIQDDAAGVYNAVLTKQWSDWHTIGYLIFVYICTRIKESMYSVIVVQSIIWVVLNFYILEVLSHIKKAAVIFYTIVISLSITPFLYLESMGKDTVFSMGILALTVVVFKTLYFDELNKKDIIILSTIPLFSILCRHGGLVSVIGVYIVLIIYYAKNKSKMSFTFCKIGIFHLFMYFVVTVLILNALQADKNPAYVKYGTPISMIGAAVSQDVTFSDKDQKILEEFMPLDKWRECYNKYWADDLSRSWGKNGENIERLDYLVNEEGYGIEILKINAKILIKYPITYLRAFFDMNSILWEMARPSDVPIMELANVPENKGIIYHTGYYMLSALTVQMDQNAVLSVLFTRGGFSLYVIIFAVVLFGMINRKFLISLIPILVNEAILFITIPAQDARYILPTIECAIFIGVILMTRGINPIENNDSKNFKN